MYLVGLANTRISTGYCAQKSISPITDGSYTFVQLDDGSCIQWFVKKEGEKKEKEKEKD